MSAAESIPRPQLATEVTNRFRLSDEARELLTADKPAARYFAELAEASLYDDAICFAAFYLTPREAVWWGALCVWQAFRDAPPASELALLKVVSDWVIEPSESRRRAAYQAAKSIGLKHTAAGLAMGVFYAGGSISIPDQPHVDPPVGQTARSVIAAVMLASQKLPLEIRPAYLRHCLELASEVSQCEAMPVSPDDILSPSTQQEYEHA